MKKKRGFLLIELMFALVALSFMLSLFAQFFSSVISWHKEARSRLEILLIMQNHSEKIWQGLPPESLEKNNILYTDLALPHIEGLIMPRLKYGMLEHRTPTKSIVVQLPGYIYEAT